MRIQRFAIAALVLFSLGCAVKHPDTTPVTGYEKAVLANATLAQTNNSIARGVVQLQGASPAVLSQKTTEKILRIQATIAADDNRLTVILDQGPEAAKGHAAEIRSLIMIISQEIDEGINDGSLSVKNPASQQLFTADLEAIKGLALQITNTLKLAGVLE